MKRTILIAVVALLLGSCACQKKEVGTPKSEASTPAVKVYKYPEKHAAYLKHLEYVKAEQEKIKLDKSKTSKINSLMSDNPIEYCGHWFLTMPAAVAAQDRVDSAAYIAYPEDLFPPDHYFPIDVCNDLITDTTFYRILPDDLTTPLLGEATCKTLDLGE